MKAVVSEPGGKAPGKLGVKPLGILNMTFWGEVQALGPDKCIGPCILWGFRAPQGHPGTPWDPLGPLGASWNP